MPEKIKAVIIDDEKLAREITKKFLSSYDNVEIAAECSNGFEGLKSINELKPDLIFLDIQMPKITGFEMLELIDEPPVIVFTTAYDQYALKAFEVNAADYLLKPFSKERFDEALKKAFQRFNNKNEKEEIVNKLTSYNELREEWLQRIVIKNGTQIIIIPTDEIMYLEAQDDYVMIYSEKGKFLKQKTMKYFEDHLSQSDFVRVHRSYIAAVRLIKKIEPAEKDSYRVLLDGSITLPVSKTGYQRLKEIL